MSKFRKSP